MKARTAPRAVWSLWAVIAGLSVAALALTALDRSVIDQGDVLVQVGMSLAALGYGTVGAMIAAHRQKAR